MLPSNGQDRSAESARSSNNDYPPEDDMHLYTGITLFVVANLLILALRIWSARSSYRWKTFDATQIDGFRVSTNMLAVGFKPASTPYLVGFKLTDGGSRIWTEPQEVPHFVMKIGEEVRACFAVDPKTMKEIKITSLYDGNMAAATFQGLPYHGPPHFSNPPRTA